MYEKKYARKLLKAYGVFNRRADYSDQYYLET